MSSSRRTLLKALTTLAITAPLTLGSLSALAADTEIRIGWQKGSSLAVIKARGEFEKTLKAQHVDIKWLEFPAGPQMLEALNVGSIDLGVVGETPPVFAHAAGADLLYVGYEPPAVKAEALLVPKDSPIKSVAELKGKRVVLNKGSNVHYLLVRLLEKAGLKYSDVNVAYLKPSDARAAFEKGAVDAWVIWDPYATAAEAQVGARRLADASGVADNHNFYIGARPFAEKHPKVLKTVLKEIDTSSQWIGQNLKESAAIVAPQIGLPVDVAERAFSHYSFNLLPLTKDVVARQQRIADTFTDLKLIPKKLDIASVVWDSSKH